MSFLLLAVNSLIKLYSHYILSVSMDFITTMASNYCFLNEGTEYLPLKLYKMLECQIPFAVVAHSIYISLLYPWCLTVIPMLKYGI